MKKRALGLRTRPEVKMLPFDWTTYKIKLATLAEHALPI